MTEKNLTNTNGVIRPVQIIPSVLPADWANMGACVKNLEDAGVDRIQFDVMDGNFVPNLTFGPEMISACRKYCEVPFETQLLLKPAHPTGRQLDAQHLRMSFEQA